MDSQKNLIIYFAGHGQVYGNTSYLVPYDAIIEYKDPNNSRLISFSDIFKWIENSNVKHIVLILDACHAGNIITAKRTTIYKSESTWEEDLDELIGKEDLQPLKINKSVWVLT